jgi:hypothetical protein
VMKMTSTVLNKALPAAYAKLPSCAAIFD